MTEAKSILFDNFYFISELLNDDLDFVCDFMLSNTSTKLNKQRMMYYIENAKYEKIEKEINQCLDLKTSVFKLYLYKQYIKEHTKTRNHQQILKF